MRKRLIVIGVILVLCLASLTGCAPKYNAKLYYNMQSIMNEEYLKENLTSYALYNGGYATDLPETKTHIISNENELEEAFKEFPEEVDFNDKMILIHFFTSLYPTKPYKLEKVKRDGDTLYIEFKLNKPWFSGCAIIADAASPQQTCIAVIIDKLDINEVIFKKV